MDILDKIPQEYRAFPELVLCSNTLKDVKILLAVNDDPILLIGDGSVPLVWLAAPTGPTSTIWRFVVEKSKSQNPAVEVKLDFHASSVDVLVSGSLVLRVQKISDEKAVVSKLDLMPLGLAVTGDSKALKVGGSTVSNSTFGNAVVAFGFDIGHGQAASEAAVS